MQDFHLLPIFAVVLYAMIPQSKQCIMVPRPFFVILPRESVKLYSQQMFVCMKLMKSPLSYSSVSGSQQRVAFTKGSLDASCHGGGRPVTLLSR